MKPITVDITCQKDVMALFVMPVTYPSAEITPQTTTFLSSTALVANGGNSCFCLHAACYLSLPERRCVNVMEGLGGSRTGTR